MDISGDGLRLLAPAKINLHLRVGRRRPDGYHPLLSWMGRVGLFDRLEFRYIDRAGITLTIDPPGLPVDRANLVVRVAEAFAQALDVPPARGVAIHLQKHIPVGAGMGGGSSDAASTLLALNRLWQVGWTNEQLATFSASFGSDLPFFFAGPSALCAGRGEIVHPLLPPRARRWAVLMWPDFGLPTAVVYKRFDEMNLGESTLSALPAAVAEWQSRAELPAIRLLPQLVNDLEPAAFSLSPPLARLREALEQAMGRIVRMSGSGSSLFTLCDDEVEAAQLAKQVGLPGVSVAVATLAGSSGDDAAVLS